MIEPEVAVPAAGPRRHRRAVTAAFALLAVAAAGVAVTGGSARHEPAPLALMAGATDAARGEATATPAIAPAIGTSDGRSALYPFYDGGLTYEVAGDLPGLGDRARVWTVSGPAVDRADMTRIAATLGLHGTPQPRDGGWSVDDGDWTLSANPSGDFWSVGYYRSKVAGGGDDAAPSGPALSAAEVEQRVRQLVAGMGAPAASWKAEVAPTEIGLGWACAAAAEAVPMPELTADEAAKVQAGANPPTVDTGAGSSANSGSSVGGGSTGVATPAPPPDAVAVPTPAGKPAPDGSGSVLPCPSPPPPAAGFAVSLYPVLDGVRADWPVWSATLRTDGRVENLSGAWAAFESGADYRLRTVAAALDELRSGSGAFATTQGKAADLPALAPVCPAPMPLPPQKGAADPAGSTTLIAPTCPSPTPPRPTVVKITGVELGLIQAPVFEDGRARLHLVPAYRFLGHLDGGSDWQTSVIALHPDAIAPPPAVPVADDAREGGVNLTGR